MPRKTNVKDIPLGEMVLDELPESTSHNPLQGKLEQIKSNSELHRKWVGLRGYPEGGTASAAKSGLKDKYGDVPEVMGWAFDTIRTDTDPTGPAETTLFARYDPTRVAEGEEARWNERKARKIAEKAKKAPKVAVKKAS